jgi:PAS domain S-box-containing protein
LTVEEILSAAPDGIIAIDHEGKVTEFNEAAEKMFGYLRKAAVGKEFSSLIIPPLHQARYRHALATYNATGEASLLNKRVELTVQRADGAEFPAELTIRRIGNKSPPQFVGFVRNITGRKRGEEQLQRHRQRAAALHEINSAISSSLDLKTILEFLLNKIDLLLPYSAATVRLLNRATGTLEGIVCTNFTDEEWKVLKDAPGRGLADIVLETLSPLFVANAQIDVRTRHPQLLQQYGLVSYLGIPLTVRGERLGVISFYTREEHHFSAEEIEFLSTLAGQVAIAIHNSQLYLTAKEQAVALERSNQRTTTLHAINLAITSCLDLQAVLDFLLEKIDLFLPYAATTLRLLNKQTGLLEPRACRNLDESEWKARKWTSGHGLSNAVLNTREPVIVVNARLDPRVRYPERLEKYGLYSYLGLPLIVKGDILGVISFYTKEEHHFSREEIEFLSTLAGEAAIAIHNSQLYEQTKQHVAALKRSNDQLRQSEERFRIIARATNDAIWDWDLTTNAVSWNEGVRTLFGYSEAEVGPDANWWYDHIDPEDREEVVTGIHTVIRSGSQFWSSEYRFRRRDSSVAYVFDRGYVIHDAKGTAVRMMGAMVDITERKLLQKRISEIRETEQQRIGRDLHDGLGQHLTGLACLAKALEQKLTAKTAPEGADARLITTLINDAITQTHSLARGLYPVELQANGLVWALEDLASKTSRIFNVSCSFECHKPVLIPDNAVAVHLYRIAQGAVDNSIKHGKASHIIIRLSAENGKTILGIRDDGVGLPVNFWIEPTTGMGLHIMRYRAEMIGASLAVRPDAEGGTTVICVFPNTVTRRG